MKNTNFLKAMLFVCTLAGAHNAGYAQDKAGAPPQEYSLNVSLQQVTNQVLKKRATNFITYFKTISKSFPSPYVVDSINELGYDSLTAVFVKFLTANTPKTPYFTAIHIFLGLDKSDNMKLVFVPLIADSLKHINGMDSFLIAPLATSATTKNNFDNSDSIYTLKAGKFVSVTSATAEALIDSYQSRILINGRGTPGGTFRHFANTGDVTGDVKSLIYSCQAIAAIHTDQTKQTIYITSISEMDEFHQLDSFKHTIAFGDVLPGSSDTVISMCSNLATMCPPACNGGISVNPNGLVANFLPGGDKGKEGKGSPSGCTGNMVCLKVVIGILALIIILLLIKRNRSKK